MVMAVRETVRNGRTKENMMYKWANVIEKNTSPKPMRQPASPNAKQGLPGLPQAIFATSA